MSPQDTPAVQNVFFPDSSVLITGGKFGSIHPASSGGTRGWDILTKNIVTDAFHNSATRVDAARCSNDEYISLRTDLMNIINGKAHSPRVVWVHGPCNSSLIAQSIADDCHEATNSCISFFFGKSLAAHTSHHNLFIPTIAYQLCLLFPAARRLVEKAVERDPGILSRMPQDQLRDLILNPFSTLHQAQLPIEHHPRPVILIDGIHKISTPYQRSLLPAFTALAQHFPLPAMFLIFSEPSSQIDQIFSRLEHSFLTQIIIKARPSVSRRQRVCACVKTCLSPLRSCLQVLTSFTVVGQ